MRLENPLNRRCFEKDSAGRRAKDRPAFVVAALFALLVLGTLVVTGLAMGDRPARASGEPGVALGAEAADATAGALAGGPESVAAGSGSIAIKLAPGARLVEKADGTLTVVQDWASLAAAGVDAPGLGLNETDRLGRLGISVLEPAAADASGAGDGMDLETAARALTLMPGVLWAEVSRPIHACLVPNDPYYPGGAYTPLGQWGLSRVGLPAAWDITTGSADVTVAVLDSGLNRDAPDFSGRIVSPYSVLSDSPVWPAWQDSLGHGTGVAGVAVARGNDGQGIAGAAWNVKVMPVKISQAGDSDTTILAKAIEYAADHGADVINISFSGGQTSQTLTAAVAYALAKGAVIVAAAGNDGAWSVSYPAALPGVIAVGATSRTDTRWPGSNAGAALDLVAPGDDIISYSLSSAGSFAYWDGTSLSSPLVAGVAALMLSVDPSLTPGQITDIINETAEDLGASGWDQEFGWGLLDADEAVARAAGGAGTTTTTTLAATTTTTTLTTTTSTTTTTTTELPSTTTTTTGSSSTTTTQPHFADVSEESTIYWNEIGYLASLGAVSGSGDGLFRPGDSLMRQQFAKIIVRSLDYVVTGSEDCPFVDVAAQIGTDPFYPYYYVAVAYQHGITKGTNSTHFSPYRTLTRAQMITMVARAAGLAEPPAAYTPPFSRFSTVHYPSARAAAYAGLLDGLAGMGPSYDFTAPATRGEVCALVYALLQ